MQTIPIPSKRPISLWAITVVALIFGALTLKEGGAVLFGDGVARTAAGHVVPFVVWFNFFAGFAYVLAGLGLWLQQRWAARLALGIVVATALVFVGFGLHVASGPADETRTVLAMSLRTLVWGVIAAVAWRAHTTRHGSAP